MLTMPMKMIVMKNNSRQIFYSRYADAKTAINSCYSIADFMRSEGYANLVSNKQICCPFHDDSTPSFSVDISRNVWKCFGCPDGGHFLDFWIKYEAKYRDKKYTIYSAIEYFLKTDAELCKRLGFSTIFKTNDSEFDLFKAAKSQSFSSNENQRTSDGSSQPNVQPSTFEFEKILMHAPEPKHVNTDSMHQVMTKLHLSDISTVLSFIEDCERGCSEEELIRIYLKGEGDIVGDFIQNLTAKSESQDEIRDAFLEALND